MKNANTWLDDLNPEDLQALTTVKALKYVGNPDRAARYVANDLAEKGLIKVDEFKVPRASPKKKAAKKASPLHPARKFAKKAAVKPAPDHKPKVRRVPRYDSYWESIKGEFYALVCTDDSRYDELRKQLNKHKDSATSIALGVITVAFASTLGIATAIAAPFVAILLLSMMTIGVTAVCGILDEPNDD